MRDSPLRIDPEILERVRGVGILLTLADGTEFIREGEVDERLFIIESGSVEVLRAGKPVRHAHPGDVVGEFAFLDRRVRTDSVRAAGPVTVCSVACRDVLLALVEHPSALMEWMAAIAARLHSPLEGASGGVDVDAVLATLVAEAQQHRAVRHRYLRALADGTVPDLRWAMADFSRHYFGYSAHFPRYLMTVISRLERPQDRAALLENLTEESGIYGEGEYAALAEIGVSRDWITGIPHPKLFQRFRRALGVEDSGVEDDSLEVVCWREMFLGVLSGGSPAEAVGALGLGTEGVVRDIYRFFVEALGRLPELHPRDTVFFPLHTAVDDHHQTTLLDIARHYARSPQGRRDVAKGMRKALALRASFWDWMYERAMKCG